MKLVDQCSGKHPSLPGPVLFHLRQDTGQVDLELYTDAASSVGWLFSGKVVPRALASTYAFEPRAGYKH